VTVDSVTRALEEEKTFRQQAVDVRMVRHYGDDRTRDKRLMTKWVLARIV